MAQEPVKDDDKTIFDAQDEVAEFLAQCPTNMDEVVLAFQSLHDTTSPPVGRANSGAMRIAALLLTLAIVGAAWTVLANVSQAQMASVQLLLSQRQLSRPKLRHLVV